MTAAEHSTLVFLLLSLLAVPNKWSDLLLLAEKNANKNGASSEYQTFIKRLKENIGNKDTVDAIRKELKG